MARRDTFQDAGNFVNDRENLIRHGSQQLEEQVRVMMINYACLTLFITFLSPRKLSIRKWYNCPLVAPEIN